MRYLVLIVFCLMSLTLAGPVSAACATDMGGSVDSPTSMQSMSAGETGCDMGQNDTGQDKMHKCGHDACCGSQLVAICEAGDFSTLPAPRPAAVASVTKPLTTSGREPLLDPPRA